jgi:dihydrodipicolinate synthase/N-acetylneuraminate lyase
LTIFGGLNAQFLIEEFERGAAGTMPNNDIPSVFVKIWNHLESGDKASAWSLFAQALPLIRFELQPGLGVSAMKQNMVKRGILECARVRHPTATLNGEGVQELETLRAMIEP